MYDSFGRVTKHEITQNGAEAVNFTYSYDDNSNINSKIFEHRTADPANLYSYDGLDRVIRADYHNSENEQFTYERNCSIIPPEGLMFGRDV